jgi:hypothetical protein
VVTALTPQARRAGGQGKPAPTEATDGCSPAPVRLCCVHVAVPDFSSITKAQPIHAAGNGGAPGSVHRWRVGIVSGRSPLRQPGRGDARFGEPFPAQCRPFLDPGRTPRVSALPAFGVFPGRSVRHDGKCCRCGSARADSRASSPSILTDPVQPASPLLGRPATHSTSATDRLVTLFVRLYHD